MSQHSSVFVDSFDRCVICDFYRCVICDFYLCEKKVLTFPKLLPVIGNRIHFSWCTTFLYNVMKQKDFGWKKCGSQRSATWTSGLFTWRHQYGENQAAFGGWEWDFLCRHKLGGQQFDILQMLARWKWQVLVDVNVKSILFLCRHYHWVSSKCQHWFTRCEIQQVTVMIRWIT